MLTGTEVKSLREGQASLEDAYAKVDDGEVWLIGSDIPEYSMANRMNHKPKRPRKLLLHRREIAKLVGKASERGYTLVPLRMYFKQGRARSSWPSPAASSSTTSARPRRRPTPSAVARHQRAALIQ